jgi:hypothetical protein
MIRPVTPAGVDAQPVERFESIDDVAADGQARARREGAAFDELAYQRLAEHGAAIVLYRHQVRTATVDARIRGDNGKEFWVLAHGNVDTDSTATSPGLHRTDTIRKAGAAAYVIRKDLEGLPILLLTSHTPTAERRHQAAVNWLHEFRDLFWDVICVNSFPDLMRLQRYLRATPAPIEPEPAEWCTPPVEQLSFDASVSTIRLAPEESF